MRERPRATVRSAMFRIGRVEGVEEVIGLLCCIVPCILPEYRFGAPFHVHTEVRRADRILISSSNQVFWKKCPVRWRFFPLFPAGFPPDHAWKLWSGICADASCKSQKEILTLNGNRGFPLFSNMRRDRLVPVPSASKARQGAEDRQRYSPELRAFSMGFFSLVYPPGTSNSAAGMALRSTFVATETLPWDSV